MAMLMMDGPSVTFTASEIAFRTSSIVVQKCPFFPNISIIFSYRVPEVNVNGGKLMKNKLVSIIEMTEMGFSFLHFGRLSHGLHFLERIFVESLIDPIVVEDNYDDG